MPPILSALAGVICLFGPVLVDAQAPPGVFGGVTYALTTTPGNFTTALNTCISLGSGNGSLAASPIVPAMQLITGPLRGISFTLLGGRQVAAGVWSWIPTPSIPTGAVFFTGGSGCQQGSCPWGGGFPVADEGCMAANATTWISVDCAIPIPFTCELPYAVVYFCLDAQVPTAYNLALQFCLGAGSTLASIPTAGAWGAIRQGVNCANLGTARIGANNYDRGSFRSSRPYDFRWSGAFIGQEDGGRGRLFSMGEAPATPVGFPTLPWSAGQPVVTTENVVAVSMPDATLFPLTFLLARAAGTWIVCERPVLGQSGSLDPQRTAAPRPSAPSDTPYLIGVIVSSVGLLVIGVVFFVVYCSCRPTVIRDHHRHSPHGGGKGHGSSHHRRSSSGEHVRRSSSHRRHSAHNR